MPLLLLLLLAPLSWVGSLRGESTLLYIVVALTATMILYIGARGYRRHRVELSRWNILGWGLLLRLALLPMEPSLSDDAWRYLWDGRLTIHGVNPYHVVPADSSLARFHDDLYYAQGYPTTNTIYPPGAQIVFAIAMAPSESLGLDHMVGYYLYKLLLIGAEVIAIFCLLELRGLRDASFTPVILYAWHPLPIIELAGQGHTDALWVVAIGLALLGFARGRDGLPALAMGGTLRLYPLGLIPLWLPFVGARRWWRGLLRSLPFLLLLGVLIESTTWSAYTTVLGRFTNYYEFNGGIYYGLKGIVDAIGLTPSNAIAGGLCAGVIALLHVLVVWRWRRGGGVEGLAQGVLTLLTVQIIFGAKVHVWYFAPLLFMAAALDDGPLRRAWFWMGLAAPLTYALYLTQPASERADVLVLEWGGFATVIAWEWWRGRERRRGLAHGQAPSMRHHG